MLWFLTVAQAACDTASLSEELVASETAFATLDDAVDDRRAALDANLACLDRPLSPVTAALTHRTLALYAFLDEDDAGVTASFARYRALARNPNLPESLAPAGHPLRKLYDAATVSEGTRELPRIRGQLLVDGGTGPAPADQPFFLQHVDPDGQVRLTARIDPGEPLPDLGSTPTPAVRKRPRVPLLIAGGAAAVVGAAGYGSAFATRASYDRAVAAGDLPAAKRAHTQTNSLGGVGLGLVGAGAALAIVGAL